MPKLTQENTMFDIPDLNRFRIGDEVVVDASQENDRFEGTIIGIELRRSVHGGPFETDITLLHDDYVTDGFKPADCRKVKDSPVSNLAGRLQRVLQTMTNDDTSVAGSAERARFIERSNLLLSCVGVSEAPPVSIRIGPDPVYWMANDGTRDMIEHAGKINPAHVGQAWNDRYSIPLYAAPATPSSRTGCSQ
jgi:hypothetical protein